ncbi:subtilisin family serine protease [Blastococcus colisei]|uniref:Subtilisin family serine protease n=1 Tax=Blastococcus colisei TaxID=1564162 RepID=A0A543PIK7_9ACTN|nr:S8 family serine peptidase [Blastococcus colisei]TQN43912.1 subtilisin family serine protease [Blastococcus colisei]
MTTRARRTLTVVATVGVLAAASAPASAETPVNPEVEAVPSVLRAELSAAEEQSLSQLTEGAGVQVEAFVVTPGGAEIITLDAGSEADAHVASGLLLDQPSVEAANLTVPVFAVGGALPQYGNVMVRSAEALAEVDNPLADVVVAVLDTGVNPHTELAAALAPGQNFTDSPGGASDTSDRHGHGTHVAGTVGADAGSQVEGVAPGVRIMPVKVLGDDGGGFSNWANSGIVYAADNGADVINLSLGGPDASGVFRSAVDYARSKGVTVIAAAGNEGNSIPLYPAAEVGVIAVAAVDEAKQKAFFSNYGSYVDVAAPGVGITSTDKSGSYSSMSGTSMAAPHVAGVAALVKAAAPGFTPDQVEQVLIAVAEDRGATGRDDVFGHGLVDALGAVRAANAIETGTPPGAPTIGAVTPGARSAVVNWSPPTSDGGTPVTAYTVQTQAAGTLVRSDQVAAPATSATLSGLTTGTTYTFSVTATTLAATGPASAASEPVVPTEPAHVPATDVVTSHRLGVDSLNLWQMHVSEPHAGYGTSRLVETLDFGGFSYSRSRTVSGSFGDLTSSDDGTADHVIWHAQPNGGVLLWAIGGGGDTTPRVLQDLRTGGWSWAASTPMAADVTGDGLDDVVVRHTNGPSASNYWVFPATGGGFGSPQLWTQLSGATQRPVVADVDGDARADLVVARPAGTGGGLTYAVHRSTGDAFESTGQTVFTGPVSGGWSFDRSRTLAGDVTGDGLVDLVTAHDQSAGGGLLVWVHVNCTAGVTACTEPVQIWQDLRTGGWSYAGSRQHMADTDGDGDDDLISMHSQGGNPGILVWRHRSTTTRLSTPDVVADLRTGGWTYAVSRDTTA